MSWLHFALRTANSGGRLGAFGWLLGRLGAERRAFRLIEGKLFRADKGLPAFCTQINAEEVFGQRVPGVFFATCAGARRICIHSRKIPVSENRCKSLRTAPLRGKRPLCRRLLFLAMRTVRIA